MRGASGLLSTMALVVLVAAGVALVEIRRQGTGSPRVRGVERSHPVATPYGTGGRTGTQNGPKVVRERCSADPARNGSMTPGVAGPLVGGKGPMDSDLHNSLRA